MCRTLSYSTLLLVNYLDLWQCAIRRWVVRPLARASSRRRAPAGARTGTWTLSAFWVGTKASKVIYQDSCDDPDEEDGHGGSYHFRSMPSEAHCDNVSDRKPNLLTDIINNFFFKNKWQLIVISCYFVKRTILTNKYERFKSIKNYLLTISIK